MLSQNLLSVFWKTSNQMCRGWSRNPFQTAYPHNVHCNRKKDDNIPSEKYLHTYSILSLDRKKPWKIPLTLHIPIIWCLITSFNFITYQHSGFWIFATKLPHCTLFITFLKREVVRIESTSHYNLKSRKYFLLLITAYYNIQLLKKKYSRNVKWYQHILIWFFFPVFHQKLMLSQLKFNSCKSYPLKTYPPWLQLVEQHFNISACRPSQNFNG